MARKARAFHNRDHKPGCQKARRADHENPGKEQVHKPELRPIHRFKNDHKADHELDGSRIPQLPQWSLTPDAAQPRAQVHVAVAASDPYRGK